jgi:hypothetical protein
MMDLKQSMDILLDATLFASKGLAFLVLAATIVTALTPNRTDEARLDGILKFLNIVAGNVGRNRNADDA